ncbi:MAG: M20/M25/M40 family metallo-hydrolase [Syntrophotalea sp.]|jgi:tripeptide aminopeptidase|uniref:M20/M25/M40 family metallo-hydrolase n=1 Tax=Syntrophotalea sp. TaxID=2812029 RepID=UPI003D1388F6
MVMVNVERLKKEFARQAGIASPSFREGEISRYLVERFRSLGMSVVMDDAGSAIGSESGNIIARLPASGKDCEPLLLSAHMDTVVPADGVRPVLVDGIFRSAGDTVLGADDKAGLAEIVEALEIVKEQGVPHGIIEVVVTVCEEKGLLGAKHLDYSKVVSRRGLALDTSGTDRVINTAPAANKMRFVITGRESHAGIDPEKGVSAIVAAATGIAAMRLGRIDYETTANIGTIQGGSATNIIPRQVVLEGEARSHDPAKLQTQTEHMLACLRDAAQASARSIGGEQVSVSVETQVVSDYPCMAVSPDADILQLVERAARQLDRVVALCDGGGGSDANIFNAHGIETVIIGTGMTDVHTVAESVHVADMVRVTELLVEIIRLA